MSLKKRLIIKAFSEMDVSKLKELLDEDKTFHLGLNKKSFIDKMSDVFDRFKKLNNNTLTIHKGKCNGGNCYLKGNVLDFLLLVMSQKMELI